jgi:uncharacterized iron-regulated membrane protein
MGKLLFVHRWIGVALALFMAIWLGSGLIIVLTDPLTVDRATQLAHAEQLAPHGAWLDPALAWARGGKGDLPGEARLVRVADTVYWLFRMASGDTLALDATTGERRDFSAEDAVTIVEAWLAAPAGASAGATSQPHVIHIDKGEAPAFIRAGQGLGPFHRLVVEDGRGTEVFVSARSGEVIAVASAFGRGLYYASSWIHLLHPLDFLGETRDTVLAWTGGLAFVASLTGMIIGWIRWRPGLFGRKTWPGGRQQPYRRFWLATHFWTGLIGGTVATLWAFSGFVHSNPGEIFSSANATREEQAVFAGKTGELAPLRLNADAADGLSELVWRRLGDVAIAYGLTGEGAKVALDGAAARFDRQALTEAALRLAGDRPLATVAELSDYDSYYYRNRRQGALDRPLPVVRVDLADKTGTRLYIDAADGRLLLKQDSSRRAYRWLFTALHHWDFAWLLAWKPAWYGWMTTWALVGVTLGISSVYLGWRRLRMTYDAQKIAREERAAAKAGAPASAAE